MQTTSLWQGITGVQQEYPSLDYDIETGFDVAIIGAGITGITAALLLAEAGLRVVILEAYTIGAGTTGNSTGNLYIPIQPHYQAIKANFSQETVAKVAHARMEAIDFVENIVNAKKIDCHFARRPFYYFTTKDDKIVKLQKELKILQAAGIKAEETLDMPLPVPHRYAIRFDNQARFNPLAYVKALAKEISGIGVKIFENTQVLDFTEENAKVSVKAAGGKLKAKWLIEATHTPKGFNMVQTMNAAYRSYVTAFYPKEGMIPDGEYADLSIPGHYISTQAVHKNVPQIICLAGSHHKTGQAIESNYFDSQEEYIKHYFSQVEIAYRWSAQHYHSGDGLPYIGFSRRNARRTLMATGYYADGLTYGTVAARILADIILEKDNICKKLFDSTRFTPLVSTPRFVKENANVAAQYVQHPPLGLKNEDFSDLANGEAKVVQHIGTKWAAYKDEGGELHILSAICPHLGCVVAWNDAEKSWDCPCHGSRFDVDGKVIEGPAFHNLQRQALNESSPDPQKM